VLPNILFERLKGARLACAEVIEGCVVRVGVRNCRWLADIRNWLTALSLGQGTGVW
jgi:hypothetical protein